MRSFGVRFLSDFIIWKEKHLKHRQFVYILSFIIGIVSGLAAVLLKNVVHLIHHFLLNNKVLDNVNFIYLFFPLAGILLTMLYVKYFVKDNIGHGVSRILFAISRKGGSIKSHNNFTSLIASAITVGFGGSVGLEAPIVLTGSSLGSSFGKLFKLNYKTKIILIGCGAAGAIAGIFKAPIAAVIFGLEVLMLDLTMWSLVPMLISAVTGLTIAYFFMGKGEIFHFTMVNEFLLKNIPFYILLGIFTGFISLYFTRVTMWIEKVIGNLKNSYAKWIIGGTLLGLMILLLPPLYGEGYDTLNALLNGNSDELTLGSMFYNHSDKFWIMILFFVLILIFKVFATAITTGAGGVGGIFAPTLFMGGVAGYLLAKILNIFNFIGVSERNFALVGMAGMMAGVMHAPLTAVFLIAEITGGYALFIPLLITATIAFITIMYFEPHSIYHMRLAARKELITHHKDQAVLTLIDMGQIIEKDFQTVHPDNKLKVLIDAIASSKRNIFPVVKNKMLVGVVLLDDIRHVIFNTDLYDNTYVRDLMYLPPAYVEPDEPMDEVMEKFEETGSWNLPVLKKGEYVGFLSKSKLFSVYRSRLIEISGEH
ncbi:MAG: chloride channel protein [Bacteroidales bacterium]|nr:chloride channel protein [Bacteroidales bacterium]MBN2821101.1 chloride channel protein [Bacteroidales bacterium]